MKKSKIHWSNWVMFPFALVYGLIVSFRNFMYDNKILKSFRFDLPIIGVGNLSAGGSGKTPHVEYLIRLLQPYINVATLSRGYKRESKGFLEVLPNSTATSCGDEPLLLKRKYRDVPVFVNESRVNGVHKILTQNSSIQTILLDDIFQHRSLMPGLNLLLTPVYDLYVDDFLLPVGRLRESISSADRANAIIVTKCKKDISTTEMLAIRNKINPNNNQKLFFSSFKYGAAYSYFSGNNRIVIDQNWSVLMVSGIANTTSLTDFLNQNTNYWKAISYGDHHQFSQENWEVIHDLFQKMDQKQKIVLVTEKDAVRLDVFAPYFQKMNLPVYVLPIEVEFIANEGELHFDEYIKNWLLSYKS